MSEVSTVHPFEVAGLGLAPFRCTGHSYEVGPRKLADGTEVGSAGQPMGCCDYCGQGIANVYYIKSSDGRIFTVGCDCVLKIGRSDNVLTTQVKRLKNQLAARARESKRLARREQREAAIQADLQAQRSANGGLTNYELKQKREAEAQAATAAAAAADNLWILERLPATSGSPFIQDMIARLKTNPLSNFSERQLQVLGEVWAKTWGRQGSQACEEAAYEFEVRVWPERA